jgi:hypothetical protein
MKVFMNNLVEIPCFDVVSYPDAKFLQFTGEVSHLITDPDTTTSLQKPAPPPTTTEASLHHRAPTSTYIFPLVIKWTYSEPHTHPSGSWACFALVPDQADS